jgi:DNA-binding response OmpR family regulator
VKILVVEDNKKLSSFLFRALSEEGHVVDVVEDGEIGRGQAEVLRYDLVILDWMLPGLDGLSVCRAIRARGLSTPILMLSARGEVEERVLGLDAGADDYLPKPFDLSELLARVRALGRRTNLTPQVLRAGPISIDVVERRAELDGRRLELTPRELALLTYLVREVGRPVPKTELLERVWDLHFDPGSNVVEVHVRNLREKLDPRADLIETVRGIGYRLRAEASAP